MLTKIATTMMMTMALVAMPLSAAEKSTDYHKAAQVASMMDRIEMNALDMREQAGRLKTFNRAPQLHSWEVHAAELSRISNELDNVASLIKELKPMKPYMTFRQAAAFNHLISLSAEASDVTEDAIEMVNTEKEKLNVAHPDYEKKVNAIYDHADMIATHADNVEDWAEFIEELSDSSDD